MKKNLAFVTGVAVLALGAGTALAGGSEGSIGVGAEATLFGLGGLSVNYDAGPFHVGGFFGFSDGGGDDDTQVDIGGRFYYHIHSTSMADFGVGGAIAVGMRPDNDNDDDDEVLLTIDPGFQFRAFLSSNVALSVTGGLAIGVADADGVLLSGQLTGGAGIHYYFY